jgi:hypothetical protein
MRSALLLALLAPAFARADDARDRDARAALALAAAKSAVSTAPAPRVAAQGYAKGYAAAVADGAPLVLFVGTPSWPVPGAVTAKAGTFPDVTAPAVVVSYPKGSRMFLDSTVDPDHAKVAAAVRAAQRKIDTPPAKGSAPAPKPLDWNL